MTTLYIERRVSRILLRNGRNRTNDHYIHKRSLHQWFHTDSPPSVSRPWIVDNCNHFCRLGDDDAFENHQLLILTSKRSMYVDETRTLFFTFFYFFTSDVTNWHHKKLQRTIFSDFFFLFLCNLI